MKLERVVPTLIGLVDRGIADPGVLFALGEIADARATPVLLGLLRDDSCGSGELAIALGKLKGSEAVPLLTARLQDPQRPGEPILEALTDIGDRKAVEPIELYMKSCPYPWTVAAARRALANIRDEDPVASLLDLLATEQYEPERADLIRDLTRYRDQRTIDKFADMASSSPSAFMRRDTIHALKRIGNRESLTHLASLLDTDFPRDLKAEWGWKLAPDFTSYFPKLLEKSLEEATGQKLGTDSAAWRRWIQENVAE
jgi:HEAT repeat protein